MFTNPQQTEQLTQVSSRLFELRAHRFVREYHRLHRLFALLSTEAGADQDESSSIIPTTALAALDRLDDILFALNALTKGGDVDTFFAFDQLKQRLSASLTDTEQPVSFENILGHIVGISTQPDVSELLSVSDCQTAHDFLLYGAQQYFKLMDRRFVDASRGLSDTDLIDTLLLIPSQSLGKAANRSLYRVGLTADFTDALAPDLAAKFLSAVQAFHEIGAAGSRVTHSPDRGGCTGMLCHSARSFTLFHRTPKYTCVCTVRTAHSASGNYARLLVTPAVGVEPSELTDEMFRRLLRWVDFETFQSGRVTVAVVENVTSELIDQHVDMLGKLLCFIAHPDADCRTESEMVKRIEVFLEKII